MKQHSKILKVSLRAILRLTTSSVCVLSFPLLFLLMNFRIKYSLIRTTRTTRFSHSVWLLWMFNLQHDIVTGVTPLVSKMWPYQKRMGFRNFHRISTLWTSGGGIEECPLKICQNTSLQQFWPPKHKGQRRRICSVVECCVQRKFHDPSFLFQLNLIDLTCCRLH